MRIMWVLPLLAGCAVTPFQMQHMGQSRVCYLAATGGPQTSANARGELERRGYTCTSTDIQAAIAQQRASDAALMNAATLLQRPPAPTIQPMPIQNCTTRIINGVAYTNCN